MARVGGKIHYTVIDRFVNSKSCFGNRQSHPTITFQIQLLDFPKYTPTLNQVYIIFI